MLVFMSPVSLVVAINRCLVLPPLLYWLAQERNWVRTHGSVSQRAVNYVGSPFFSGAVALPNSVDDYVKGCYMWSM
jgi:hypothetical protein